MEYEVGAPGALRGPDVRSALRRGSYGVTGASAPDGVSTVEFTTDAAVHGPRGAVRVRRGPVPDEGAAPAPAARSTRWLRAELRWATGGLARCGSDDSVRFFGPFDPPAEAIVDAAGAVRLVARAPDGTLLAGPVTLGADDDSAALDW
jgi:hypothetical protein